MAGHVGLELRNVDPNYPFERSHRFAGIQPNSGFGDYSRLSCGVGDRAARAGSLARAACQHRRARPADGVAGSDAGRADEPHNHPSSQPTQVVIDASPSGATKERSQSYQRPLQAKRVQTIAQTTALTPKRPNRATSAPRAFPSIFPPESVKTVSRRAPIIWRSRDEAGRHRCVGRRITQNFGGAR